MLTPDSISALLRAGESETLEFAPSFGPDVIETPRDRKSGHEPRRIHLQAKSAPSPGGASVSSYQ